MLNASYEIQSTAFPLASLNLCVLSTFQEMLHGNVFAIYIYKYILHCKNFSRMWIACEYFLKDVCWHQDFQGHGSSGFLAIHRVKISTTNFWPRFLSTDTLNISFIKWIRESALTHKQHFWRHLEMRWWNLQGNTSQTKGDEVMEGYEEGGSATISVFLSSVFSMIS